MDERIDPNLCDDPTRLIRWQRLTITALLVALGVTGTWAKLKSWHEATCREESQRTSRLLFESEARHRDEQSIIRDLDRQLTKYVKKYGALPREGEGVLIGKLGLKEPEANGWTR